MNEVLATRDAMNRALSKGLDLVMINEETAGLPSRGGFW